MMQEARNTDRHASGWGVSRLRDNAVTFVSAGNLSREEPQGQLAQESSSSEEEEEDSLEEESVETHAVQENEPSQSAKDFLHATESMHITKPMHIAEPIYITEPAPVHEQTSKEADETSSDEDELVFSGRNAPVQKAQPERPKHVFKATATAFTPSPTPAYATLQPSQQARSQPSPKSPQNLTVKASDPEPAASMPIQQLQPPADNPLLSTSSDAAISSGRRRPVNSRYRKGWRSRKQVQEDEEDAILQDYIANMAKDDEDDDEEAEASGNKPHRRNETFRYYDGAAESHVKVQTTSNGKRNRKPPKQAIDWSSDDLEVFDDLSTTDDEVDEIEQVLRFRERPSGPQYLVTALGQTTNDAKWILHGKLTSATALNEIQVFEEISNMDIEIESEDSESGSSSEDEALDDLIEDIESEADENTRIFEHTQRMTDEEIARVLAKQEELGMGGDELMLFDGQQVNDDSEDVFGNENGFIPFSMAQHTSNRGRSKRNRKQRDSFPSAGAFADALDQDPYGGFDVMDFDRPSLRSKRKGKSYPFDLDLEDEELERQLLSTWMKDREKKTARKREKMEERASELLEAGLRNDPSVIKAEMRRFLVEDTDTLKLAPMDPHLRASVHRLAKALHLHSRSEGKEGVGAGRFPVLTKTPRTPYYTVDTIWEVDALFNMRKFFPKHGGGSYKGARATKVFGLKKGKDRGGFSAASYANGEIVGAAAPELGTDNKGRALLEKMGWVSGMGIGKEGNEGTLEHVKHVVKTNKAGLG